MESVLIVSSTEKSVSFFMETLFQNPYKEIVTVKNCGAARRLLIERSFDLCIVNAPLPDELGDDFAQNVISKSVSQVILVVSHEIFDEISAKVEDFGIFTISKPVGRDVFCSALKLANSAFNQIARLQNENTKLLQKIEDIRIIDRAKCILIEYLSMSEKEAHKYIEKQAMDMRITRKKVADKILKTYES